MIDKALPYDIEIEKVVLGSILADKNALPDNEAILFPDLFYHDIHVDIFKIITALYVKHSPVNLVTVAREIKDEVVYINRLTDLVTYENLEYYIRILTELYIKRKGIIIAAKANEAFYDKSKDVFETLNSLENNLSDLNSHIVGKDFESDILIEAETTYQLIIGPKETSRTGISTGNGQLTNLTGGWNKGELTVIAARPSHGKTTRALQFALYAAIEHNKKAAFFSMEMKKEVLHKKMFSNISQIDEITAKSQSWMGDEFETYTHAKERVKHSGIFICDISYMTPNKLRMICRERKRKYGLDIVFVDYLQKMRPNERNYSREQEISEISNSLKSLAMELDIPVVTLAQLNRECEARPNKRPMASDLRDSGAIEQDADLILSLYSPSKYYSLDDDKDYNIKGITEAAYELTSEMAILKHRNGESGIKMWEEFHKSKSLFK